MPVNRYPKESNFGLLPEPEGRSSSFFVSAVVNGVILALLLYIGATTRHVLEQRQYEQTVLIIPQTTPLHPRSSCRSRPRSQEPPKLPDIQFYRPQKFACLIWNRSLRGSPSRWKPRSSCR